jgi:protein O-mannosyl-transferase
MAQKSNKAKSPAAPQPVTAPAADSGNLHVQFFKTPWMPTLLLMAAAFVAWAASISNDFVFFDDDKAILYNKALQSPSFSKFFSGQNLGMFAPMTWIAYWIGKGISGELAWGHHLLGVLLHAANAALAYLVLHKLTGRVWPPFAAALLFAVHPIQAEAVCWAAALSAVLFSTFYLAGLFAWLHWDGSGKKVWYAAALGAFLLACLSKSAAVTFPLMIAAFDAYKGKNWKSTSFWLEKVPFFGLSLLFGLWTFSTRAQEGHDIAATSAVFGAVDRFFMVCQTLLFYPFKLLLPVGYSVAYPFVKTGGTWHWTYFAAPVALAGIGFVTWRYLRHKPAFLLALGLYLIPLAVMLPFRTVGSFELRSDRYAYLSCLGVFYLLALLLDSQRATVKAAALGVGAVVLIALSNMQSTVWKNGVRLFENCVEKTPESALCQCNLAYNELINSNFEKSVKHYTEALAYDPGTVEAYNGRGQAYLNLRKVPEALADFDKAVKAGIVTPKLFLNRGKCKVMMQQWLEAVIDLSKSLELEPKSHEAYFFRALARDKANDHVAALEDYTKSIELNENNVEALVNRAMIYFNAKMFKEAIADQTKALGIAAEQYKPLILNNRATAHLYTGDLDAAITDLDNALKINPQYVRALQTRASVWQKKGDTAKMQADLNAVAKAR